MWLQRLERLSEMDHTIPEGAITEPKCVLLRRVRSTPPLSIENMLRNLFLMISRVLHITTHEDPEINVRSSLTVRMTLMQFEVLCLHIST